MALSLGKLTILVGAGILGSVLAKEGRMPSVSDVLSGALKIALKPIRQNDSANTTSKPRNDALIAQVNNLRQELQLLASNRQVTVVTSSGRGGIQYGGIFVIVVIGYGFVWWKGWKLPDFMFATKRSLSDACNSVAKQLEQVYSSISADRRDLSSKIDRSTRKYDEIGTYIADIKDGAAEIRGLVPKCAVDIEFMMHKVQTLEMRAGRVEEGQDAAMDGLARLMRCTKEVDLIQDSPSSYSRPALERAQITPSSRTGSLPLVLSTEPPSPSAANGSSEVSQAISETVENTLIPRLSNGNHVSPSARVSNVPELTPSVEATRSKPIVRRTISATQYFM